MKIPGEKLRKYQKHMRRQFFETKIEQDFENEKHVFVHIFFLSLVGSLFPVQNVNNLSLKMISLKSLLKRCYFGSKYNPQNRKFRWKNEWVVINCSFSTFILWINKTFSKWPNREYWILFSQMSKYWQMQNH